MDRGAWWATIHRGHKELDTTEGLTQRFVPFHVRDVDEIRTG